MKKNSQVSMSGSYQIEVIKISEPFSVCIVKPFTKKGLYEDSLAFTHSS